MEKSLMSWQPRVLFLIIGLAIVIAAVALIRKHRLRDEYAVLWVSTGLVFLVMVLLPKNLVAQIAGGLDMDWGAVFSIVCFLFLAAIVLHYSIVLTRSMDRQASMEQEIALLRDELERLRSEFREVSPPTVTEPRPKPPALRT
jgi:hypothetical protein